MSKKYRPYFSLIELTEISTALKEKPSPIRLKIIKYLAEFTYKADNGMLAPSVELIGTKNTRLKDSLGIINDGVDIDAVHKTISKLERAADTHKRWMDNPSSLSPKEIEQVMEYRFQNELMTQDEENEYIKSLY